MRILLVCNQGVSTGMLVENMKNYASEGDAIEAVPVSKVNAVIQNFDVVLVGPQIRYKFEEIRKITNERKIPAEMVDMTAYGMMDGKKVFDQAKKMYESRGNE